MSQKQIHEMGVADMAAAIANKNTSAVEAAQALLARAKQHENLGAYLAFNEELTLSQAKAADARIAAGERGPLLGVPIAHKDIFVTQGFPSTAGSKMLEGYQSPFDATVVANLAKAGAVTLGKLNCDEFAMGGSNENSAYGVARNPWDVQRVPGGSSGGSAVAVAARLAPAVTGTDTGGSIRQPASFTGITGIKPTYGRCSRYGMVAFASSLDQAGPMARSAADCATLLTAMAGPDIDRDSTSLDHPAEDYTRLLGQAREGVEGLAHADEAGGLSGAPVRDKSTHTVRMLAAELGGKLPIIAAGGITEGDDGVPLEGSSDTPPTVTTSAPPAGVPAGPAPTPVPLPAAKPARNLWSKTSPAGLPQNSVKSSRQASVSASMLGGQWDASN